MENHQDQYSMFPRWKVRKLLPSATHHVIEVTYCCQDKQIFTKSIKLNVEWIDPQVEANFYMVTLNPTSPTNKISSKLLPSVLSFPGYCLTCIQDSELSFCGKTADASPSLGTGKTLCAPTSHSTTESRL